MKQRLVKALFNLILILFLPSLYACEIYFSKYSSKLEINFSYLQSNDYQLDLWRLKKTSLKDVKELEDILVGNLKETAVKKYSFTPDGDSKPLLLTLTNNIKGIFKRGDNTFFSSIEAEIAAYRIDKLLGLGIVPITTRRHFNGNEGSIQLFVENATPAMDVSKSIIPDQIEMAKMDIFDYIIVTGNERHTLNYLITDNGKVIAIDHGLALRSINLESPNFQKTTSAFLNSEEGRIFLDKISSISKEKLEQSLNDLLDNKTIDGIYYRLDQILKLYYK